MSEKHQHTAVFTREQMLSRYDDGYHHKHDKCHRPYRLHYKTHPVLPFQRENSPSNDLYQSTGRLRAKNLRKLRKRLDKGRIH